MPRQTTFIRRLLSSALPLLIVLTWIGCASQCLHGAENPDTVFAVNAAGVDSVTAAHVETCGISASPMIATDRRLADHQPFVDVGSHYHLDHGFGNLRPPTPPRSLRSELNLSPPELYIRLRNFRT